MVVMKRTIILILKMKLKFEMKIMKNVMLLQKENGDVRNNIVLEANDVLYVLEMILLFHAWYKYGG